MILTAKQRQTRYPQDAVYIKNLAKNLRCSEEDLAAVMGVQELTEVLSDATPEDFLAPQQKLINLHTHTTASDGHLPPEEYVQAVMRYQQTHLGGRPMIVALTDHDTMAGLPVLLKSLIQIKPQNIRFVLGCELSTIYHHPQALRPIDFEVLAYGVNPFDTRWTEVLKKQSARRIAYTKKVITAWQKIGFPLSLTEFLADKANVRKGLGCNLPYALQACASQYHMPLEALPEDMWTPVESWCGTEALLSVAHPYRISLNKALSEDYIAQKNAQGVNPWRAFMQEMLNNLHRLGVQGMEIYYGALQGDLATAFDVAIKTGQAFTDTQKWIQNVMLCAHQGIVRTGGSDNHTDFFGTALAKKTDEAYQEVLRVWQEARPLIEQGYRILNKKMHLVMPGSCMPATSLYEDTGIGSPYGKGAQRLADFFVLDKVMVGPLGKTTQKANHSPYMSSLQANPFLVPLEELCRQGVLSERTLQEIYDTPKTPTQIDFAQVEKAYQKAWQEAATRTHKSQDACVQKWTERCVRKAPVPYVSDIQASLPNLVYESHPELFLPDYCLGTPADAFSPQPRCWHIRVWRPDLLTDGQGHLGEAGQCLYDLCRQVMQQGKGGVRVDHFIGWVNPFVISDTTPQDNGRLYSSYQHPILGAYAKKNIDEFAAVTQDILMKAAHDMGWTENDLYVEDVGARPNELDPVMDKFGLGRLLIGQFVRPQQDDHMYQVMRARPQDVAAIDTHDSPSVQDFFARMNDGERTAHAYTLCRALRFNYMDDLKSTEALVRMKWGELLACPAERIQAFFTSFLGQAGRYNEPGNPQNKWVLRCPADFEQRYFKQLKQGCCYNPLDAIALAIYAKSDAFYAEHKDFVHALRSAEQRLFAAIDTWLNTL